MLNMVTLGDCRELTKEIPDSSIDMLFTDPPYHDRYRYLYGRLAQEGARVLKDGAWAFIYGGWDSKEMYDLLCDADWSHFMTIALVNKGGYPRWWSKKLMIGYKPVYAFTKGAPKIMKWQANLVFSNEMDKRPTLLQPVSFATYRLRLFFKDHIQKLML